MFYDRRKGPYFRDEAGQVVPAAPTPGLFRPTSGRNRTPRMVDGASQSIRQLWRKPEGRQEAVRRGSHRLMHRLLRDAGNRFYAQPF